MNELQHLERYLERYFRLGPPPKDQRERIDAMLDKYPILRLVLHRGKNDVLILMEEQDYESEDWKEFFEKHRYDY
jgi:hypothetical protein